MSDYPYGEWEPIIGLEIHAQLNTRTKLFSRAPVEFGAEPNTNIGVMDTGQPGTLPVLNKAAVHHAILFGLAIGANIAKYSTFDRKSYFYPDNPCNFQITQFFQPILTGGSVPCIIDGVERRIQLKEAHLENDTGMLKHFSSFAGIDYNRSGVPLIEIVSEPVMHTPKEASSYAMALRAILQYLSVAKCNMDQGGMRIDANISVRKRREKDLRPRVEIKNMNSFYNMELAIDAEIRRQIDAYQANPDLDHKKAIQPGTYRFDFPSKKTMRMRSKESFADYRYFPEPDLVPLVLTEEKIESFRKDLPELPLERHKRYVEKLGLSSDSATILVHDKYTSDFFEEALTLAKNPTNLCNWIIVEFFGRLKELGISLENSNLKSEYVGKLVQMVEAKIITGKIAKQVADDMLKDPDKDPQKIVENNPDYQPVQDTSIIEPIVDQVLKDNPQSIVDYKAGRTKALAFLVGQVMKQTKGKASPEIVNELILKKIQ